MRLALSRSRAAAAYVFAKYRFWGKEQLFVVLLATMMVRRSEANLAAESTGPLRPDEATRVDAWAARLVTPGETHAASGSTPARRPPAA